MAKTRRRSRPAAAKTARCTCPCGKFCSVTALPSWPSDTTDNPGYAFALGGSLYRLSYGLNQAGTPIHLEITLNGVRQLLKVRDIRAYGEGLYIPAETIDGCWASPPLKTNPAAW